MTMEEFLEALSSLITTAQTPTTPDPEPVRTEVSVTTETHDPETDTTTVTHETTITFKDGQYIES